MSFLDPYGAGMGPAGFSPVEAPNTLTSPTLPVALRYDGATGDWQLDTNGEYKVSHPVDQGMALGLCVPRGSIASARNVGHDLLKVRLGARDEKGQVEAAVRNATPVASYLADGSVRIDRIAYEKRVGGGLAVRVDYVNLVTGRAGTAAYGNTT